MKSGIFVFITTLVIMSCAGLKKSVYSPAGTWDYIVYNTPAGDTGGEMVLVETEEGLQGTFRSPEFGDANLEKLVYGDEDKSITANFWMADLDLALKGSFEGDIFNGTIDAGQMGVFEISATRKVDN